MKHVKRSRKNDDYCIEIRLISAKFFANNPKIKLEMILLVCFSYDFLILLPLPSFIVCIFLASECWIDASDIHKNVQSKITCLTAFTRLSLPFPSYTAAFFYEKKKTNFNVFEPLLLLMMQMEFQPLTDNLNFVCQSKCECKLFAMQK